MALQPVVQPAVQPMSRTAGIAGNANAALPRKVAPAIMHEVGSRSLVIYGDSHVGKTESVGFLVDAGFQVHYVDFDHNLESIMRVSNAHNFQYYPVGQGDGTGIVKFFNELMRNNSASVCHEHGLVNCPSCSSAGESFTTLDVNALGRDCIVVWDSASAIVRAVNDAITARNGRDTLRIMTDEKAATMDNMSYFKAVASTAIPIWHWINKMPFNGGSLVITHEHDKASMMDRNAQHFYVPLAASGTYSLSSNSKTPCTAIWALKREANAANRKPILESNSTHYAKTANAANYAGLTLQAAIVKFFTRNTI